MQFAVQIGFYLAGLSLDVIILAELLRGQWKRYPFVFLYVVGDFLTTAAEIPFNLELVTPKAQDSYSDIYWIDERIVQVLGFLLVISLVYRATDHWKPRRTLLLGVGCATLLFWGITFFLHFDPTVQTGQWMTPWTRDMNFCAVILDLGLWGLLIGAREKDYKLLMVSGALGIQFTGNAIGEALRLLSHSLTLFTGFLIPIAYLSCLFIWSRAFRLPDSPPRRVSRAVPQPEIKQPQPE
jgi:hypothetical protein